ncbi:nuclear transport factor 2 family protein [Actinophytocola sp.]|uniref:nuclear transport factor 2 family protein n=1 Tax=Actinophytocola sp. TaxID=1872138 RepID=UPI00389A2E45
MSIPTQQALTEERVRAMARDWYQALDRHDPVEDVLPYLVTDGLVMVFPEATLRGLDDFRGWYRTVTHRFFDEVHELDEVTVRFDEAGVAHTRVVVRWEATVWDAPAARSTWLGFTATQTWEVVAGDGVPKIRRYVVDELDPMPGSAAL